MSEAQPTIKVGILGCGNVGAALVSLIEAHQPEITRRAGLRLEVSRVAVHNLAKDRDVVLPEGALTHDAEAVVNAPDVDVVVEVMFVPVDGWSWILRPQSRGWGGPRRDRGARN